LANQQNFSGNASALTLATATLHSALDFKGCPKKIGMGPNGGIQETDESREGAGGLHAEGQDLPAKS
jgi:hypothetical protein